ncbi:hypothetical protein OC25_03845 [Pedobacter kyungheensis]|uniref:cAMP-binding domain of CRP or a regulatory subunit of cAMP-dependent protein kinases n=2 Tax=Pedobacter TaxID=84567 RepID=A0A1G6K3K8_9SPHI|nr:MULTISPECIES: Crp/Fnr family transcriptional regulator [Pedobacter]KIA96220.1 hypothetical protein OC25_03845 [Pedobacter kyungheensis]SDC25451.1 cAMP-binding domain of CRP or a regulatory subunit of cAMP-dependent protein kinases [Pedobacter soli]
MVNDEHFGHLLKVLDGFCALPGGFADALKPLVFYRSFNNPKNILREGEVQKHIWFVAAGLVREISLSADTLDGRTSWFWYEGDFVFAHPGFFAGLSSLVDIEAYGGSVLLEISRAELTVLIRDFGELAMITEKIRYRNGAARAVHVSELVNLRHAEMVSRFYHDHKAVFLIARAKDIASFLGIKDHGIHRFLKGL